MPGLMSLTISPCTTWSARCFHLNSKEFKFRPTSLARFKSGHCFSTPIANSLTTRFISRMCGLRLRLSGRPQKAWRCIEATSDYFSSVNQVIQQVLADTKRIGTFLLSKYSAVTNTVAVESPLNSLLIDHYKSQIGASFETDFESWWMGKGFLGELITVRRDVAALYRTPSILLVYFCVSTAPKRAKQDSPLTDKELQPIYSDLGLALNDA